MDQMVLNALKPASESSVDLKAAIERAEGERAKAQGRADALEVRLTAEALTLTSKSRRLVEDEAYDARLDAKQAAAIVATLEPRLAEALKAERKARIEGAHDELKAEIAQHVEIWNEEIAAMAEKLRDLKAERFDLAKRCRSLNLMVNELHHLKIDPVPLEAARYEAILPGDGRNAQQEIHADREWFHRVFPSDGRSSAHTDLREGRRIPMEAYYRRIRYERN